MTFSNTSSVRKDDRAVISGFIHRPLAFCCGSQKSVWSPTQSRRSSCIMFTWQEDREVSEQSGRLIRIEQDPMYWTILPLELLNKIAHFTAGLYLWVIPFMSAMLLLLSLERSWELLTTLYFDWSFVSGKRRWRWPIVGNPLLRSSHRLTRIYQLLYFLNRYAYLAAMIVLWACLKFPNLLKPPLISW